MDAQITPNLREHKMRHLQVKSRGPSQFYKYLNGIQICEKNLPVLPSLMVLYRPVFPWCGSFNFYPFTRSFQPFRLLDLPLEIRLMIIIHTEGQTNGATYTSGYMHTKETCARNGHTHGEIYVLNHSLDAAHSLDKLSSVWARPTNSINCRVNWIEAHSLEGLLSEWDTHTPVCSRVY